MIDNPGVFRGVTLAINVDGLAQVDEVLSEAESSGAKSERPATDRFGAVGVALSWILRTMLWRLPSTRTSGLMREARRSK